MTDDKKGTKLPHDLILKDRKTLNISGVLDIESFDESAVVAYTELGELTVKGQNLHINKINLDTGDIELDGEINVLEYFDSKTIENGFFAKLFK